MTEDYKIHAFGLSARISSELIDDGLFQLTHDLMVEQMRFSGLRMDISMGSGLSHDDAEFLLARYDEQTTKRHELEAIKPPPTMLNTMRHWLAAKIRPTNTEDYDD